MSKQPQILSCMLQSPMLLAFYQNSQLNTCNRPAWSNVMEENLHQHNWTVHSRNSLSISAAMLILEPWISRCFSNWLKSCWWKATWRHASENQFTISHEVKYKRPYSADEMLIHLYEIFSNSQVNAEIPKVQNETPSGSSLWHLGYILTQIHPMSCIKNLNGSCLLIRQIIILPKIGLYVMTFRHDGKMIVSGNIKRGKVIFAYYGFHFMVKKTWAKVALVGSDQDRGETLWHDLCHYKLLHSFPTIYERWHVSEHQDSNKRARI